MNSKPIKWNASPSRMLLALARPRWAETGQGLTLVQMGYTCLLALVIPGVVILRLALSGKVPARLAVSPEQVVAIGWILVITGGVLAYGLVLAGQWRCLVFATQEHGAKEFLFAGLLCLLIASLCAAACYFLGGPWHFNTFQVNDLLRGSGPIYLSVVFLVLLTICLFSGFLRAVSRCLKEDHRAHGVTAFLWFMAFLMGGTLGTCLDPGRFAREDLWQLLGLAWGVCLLWHVLLIRSTNRFITATLKRRRGLSGLSQPLGAEKGQVTLQVAEMLRKSKE